MTSEKMKCYQYWDITSGLDSMYTTTLYITHKDTLVAEICFFDKENKLLEIVKLKAGEHYKVTQIKKGYKGYGATIKILGWFCVRSQRKDFLAHRISLRISN